MRLVAIQEGCKAHKEGRVAEDSADVRLGEEMFGVGFEGLDGLSGRRRVEIEIVNVVRLDVRFRRRAVAVHGRRLYWGVGKDVYGGRGRRHDDGLR